ncbi:MAG: hypothetical protein KC478_13345 [Bacteriovoracaceae bacterium]|nr:hypothetical protein [Bacteriovoracaceae bacterium]
MRAFAIIFLVIQLLVIPLTSHSSTQAPGIWIPNFVRLQCTYTYESFDSPILKEDVFTVIGENSEQSNTIEFKTSIKDIPAFFFNNHNSYPSSVWHYDSSINFHATLYGDELKYEFQFFNYIDQQRGIIALVDETRVISTNKLLTDGAMTFAYHEGLVESSRSNTGPWVNESSVKIKSCSVDMF